MNDLHVLVGKNITSIYMGDTYLQFVTDSETFSFKAIGDCCSSSYFHDFIGVEKLLNNGKVISVKEISLDDIDTGDDYDVIRAYGYEIVTEGPIFGEVTSVFSFRNASNGYYGGYLEPVANSHVEGVAKLLADHTS